MFENALCDGFAYYVKVCFGFSNAVGTHLDLLFALFSADVEQSAVGDCQCRLKQKGALADAGFAAQKHKTAWYDTATEYTVEFTAMCCYPLCLAVGHLLDALRL